MRVDIKGVEELERKLKSLSQKASGQLTNSALEESGEYLRQDAHDKCPVKGGTSADGFYVSTSKEPETGRAGAVRRSIKWRVSQFDSSALVMTSHPIARDLEFGTSREQAKPFMRRAADDKQTQSGVADTFMRVIGGGLK